MPFLAISSDESLAENGAHSAMENEDLAGTNGESCDSHTGTPVAEGYKTSPSRRQPLVISAD